MLSPSVAYPSDSNSVSSHREWNNKYSFSSSSSSSFSTSFFLLLEMILLLFRHVAQAGLILRVQLRVPGTPYSTSCLHLPGVEVDFPSTYPTVLMLVMFVC